jgi:hypothetical protein
MLYSLLPVAFIAATIAPVHLSVSMPHIIEVIALISVATGPRKYAITTFLIVCVFSFVLIGFTWSSLPDSVAMPQSVLEVALEEAAVGPIILAIA